MPKTAFQASFLIDSDSLRALDVIASGRRLHPRVSGRYIAIGAGLCAGVRERDWKRPRRLSVAVLVQMSPPIAAGPGSFTHEMLEDCGAEAAVPPSVQPYPKVSIETFIKKKPDAFLLALMPGESEGIQPIPGVQVPTVRLKSQGFMRPGPLVVEALQELTQVLDSISSAH